MTKILCAAIALLLAACSQQSTVTSVDGARADVRMVTLEDGTRCAVLIGVYKGALSCDWRAPSDERSGR